MTWQLKKQQKQKRNKQCNFGGFASFFIFNYKTLNNINFFSKKMDEFKSKVIDHFLEAEENLFDLKEIELALESINSAKELINKYKAKKFLNSGADYDFEMVEGAILYIESKINYSYGHLKKSITLVDKSIELLENNLENYKILKLIEQEDSLPMYFLGIDSKMWLGKALKFRSTIDKKTSQKENTDYLKKAEKLFKLVLENNHLEENSSSNEALYHLCSIRFNSWNGNNEDYIKNFILLNSKKVDPHDLYYSKIERLKNQIIDNVLNVYLIEQFNKNKFNLN